MREIKFRCWDILRKEMKEVGSLTISNGVTQTIIAHFKDILGFDYDIVDGESGNIMQYSGLKDKHGKEIYEGDVLDFENGYIDEILFQHGQFKTKTNYYVDSLTHCKIIGNIYKNSELINN